MKNILYQRHNVCMQLECSVLFSGFILKQLFFFEQKLICHILLVQQNLPDALKNIGGAYY